MPPCSSDVQDDDDDDDDEQEQLWKVSDRLANKNGFRHNVYWITGDLYRGNWRNNRKEGVGIHVYRSGNRYEGEWKNGRREGQGTFWVVDGGKYRAAYRGSWKDGRRHGHGTLYGMFGERYEGEFKNGKRCGVGRQTYWCPDSESFDVYYGEWSDDKRNGQGKIVLSNGDIYEGSFSSNLKEGNGTLYFADKSSKYVGLWKEGTPICGTYSKLKETCKPLPFLEIENSVSLVDKIINEASKT